MPQICGMGRTALLPLRRKACWGLFRPKNPTASAGFEPAILGTRGSNPRSWVPEASTLTTRPPKPLPTELPGPPIRTRCHSKRCVPTASTITTLVLKVIIEIKFRIKLSIINSCTGRVILWLQDVLSTFHYLHLSIEINYVLETPRTCQSLNIICSCHFTYF